MVIAFKDLLAAVLDALRFLTRLPAPAPQPGAEGGGAPHPWTMAMFPMVGLFLGAILWSASAVLERLLPHGVVDLLLLGLLALLSGAIHWDGLIDTADALGVPAQRRAEVLRDVHAGSFGVVALAFVLGIQWAALVSLSGWLHGAALLLFPVWGRWLMVAVSWNMADLRQGGGLAGAFLSHLDRRQLAWASAGSALLSVLLLGLIGGALLCALLALAAWGLRIGYRRLFGGLSGDPIGAACVLGEAAALVVLAGIG